MSEASDPMIAAQRLAWRELPKRFYKGVSVAPAEGGFEVRLDGRIVRTPGKNRLVLPTARLADAVAAEWAAQAEVIDPARMPQTRLANVALDRVAADMAAVRTDIVKYAGSDLICYRADAPAGLAAAQDAAWSPVVEWAREALGARLRLAAGVVHVPQEPSVAEAVSKAVAALSPLVLAALHVATSLTGSATIALALLHRRLTPDEAWAAAHVDEDWQITQWGADEMALAARAHRRRDFDAAATVLAGP